MSSVSIERKLAKLKVLVAVAKADGRIDANERQILESFCSNFGLSRGEITTLLEQSATVSKRDLPTSPAERNQLFVDVLRIAAADGYVSKVELALAKKIAKALGLSNAEIEECVRTAKPPPKKITSSSAPARGGPEESVEATVPPAIASARAVVEGTPAHNRLLTQFNAHTNPRAREVIALGLARDTRALGTLITALKDRTPPNAVARAAAWALGELGDKRAVEPLLEAVKTSHAVEAAARSLGKIGDPRGFDPLTGLLKHQYPGVRSAAAQALGQLGDKRAVEHLLGAIREKRQDGTGGHRSFLATCTEILVELGDVRAVRPLVELARAGAVGRSAVAALQQVLDRHCAEVEADDLRLAAGLESVVQLKYEWQCSSFGVVGRDPVNCSDIRQLARQELIRRGLEE